VAEVIGPAGKVIKKIIAATKAKIDIEEGGKIIIASTDVSAAEKAMEMIKEITVEAELGKVYQGKVVRIEEYGAFLEILPASSVCFVSSSPITGSRASGRPQPRPGSRVKVISIDERTRSG
jgi:polyribonucleotide nucleotidyltransferase